MPPLRHVVAAAVVVAAPVGAETSINLATREMQRIVYKSLMTLLGLAATLNVWGADATSATADTDGTASQTSNMQSWQEDERKDNWTWFGMGYESRRSLSDRGGAAAPGTGGGGGGGKSAGPGGPGGRR